MLEADWKIFKKIKEEALVVFCERALRKYEKIINDESLTPHERYGKNYGEVRETDKLMAKMFDGHARSKADYQLLFMRFHDLVDDEMIDKLSDEFKSDTKPREYEWIQKS